MKVLILTRDIKDYDNSQKSEAVIKEESAFGVGRVNISDALAVKKALNGLHETKITSLHEDIYTQVEEEKPDVIFNLCDDGFRGETRFEPHVAAIFDILNIPYTGNNYFTLSLCQNKARAKDVLTYNEILTPKFQVFTSAERKLDPELKFPMIVKPIREDGSLGIGERSVVENEEQLKKEVDHIINIYEQEALVEEYIDGREFTASLIGNKRPIVLPVVEIDLSELPKGIPKIVSYKAKWTKQSRSH
jgi:D-alanine-D-alanine ligase